MLENVWEIASEWILFYIRSHILYFLVLLVASLFILILHCHYSLCLVL